MWGILALGAALLTSFNPILYKRMLKDADSLVAVWGVLLLSLPLLAAFTIALTPQLPAFDAAFTFAVAASALLNVIAHLSLTHALKVADVSQVTPLLNFGPVFTLLFAALFLGEIPSARGVFGVILILLGAYWLTRTPKQHAAHEKSQFAALMNLTFKPASGLVLLAGLLWAITPVLEKTAIEHTNPTSPRLVAFLIQVLVTLLLTVAVLTRTRTGIQKLRLHRRAWILAGLIAGSAPVLGYTALSLGFVGYVTTLFKLSGVMTMLWSYFLLQEKLALARLPPTVLMVLGALLIVL